MDFITLLSLPASDMARLKNSSAVAQSLEDKWQARVKAFMDLHTERTIAALLDGGSARAPDIESLLIEHFFDVSIAAMRLAATESEEYSPIGHKLANYPKIKIPNSLQALMRLYDLWRKGKFKPNRQVAEANKIKKDYFKKVSSVWEKYSEPFRSGESFDQSLVVQQIKEEAGTVYSRAKSIVRTETTNYYNQARKEVYDQDDDVTHYLLIAIRDAATSPWCTPLTINGYRGRSGLVYAKSDPLCDKERPSCHPGCRSEYLPLNRLNPAHLRFIQNESIQRRNNTCFPLLRGWRS